MAVRGSQVLRPSRKKLIFFRPTPYGFGQVVQHVSKHVANEINQLTRAGAEAVMAAEVNW